MPIPNDLDILKKAGLLGALGTTTGAVGTVGGFGIGTVMTVLIFLCVSNNALPISFR